MLVDAITVLGKQKKMEDKYTYHTLRNGMHYAAVFDGHGGDSSAIYCQKKLHKILERKLHNYNPKKAMYESLLECNNKMKSSRKHIHSGNTAVIVLITTTKCYFASIGDSVGLLIRDNKVIYQTPVYKISDADEAKRIEKRGGVIINGRINNYLAVSRTMGDFDVIGVVMVPTVTVKSIKKNDIIVLVTDGITDRFTVSQITKIVTTAKSFNDICNKLLKYSIDNSTLLIIRCR